MSKRRRKKKQTGIGEGSFIVALLVTMLIVWSNPRVDSSISYEQPDPIKTTLTTPIKTPIINGQSASNLIAKTPMQQQLSPDDHHGGTSQDPKKGDDPIKTYSYQAGVDAAGDFMGVSRSVADFMGTTQIPIVWGCQGAAGGLADYENGRICLKPLQDPDWTRYAIAHEYGHFKGWRSGGDHGEIAADDRAIEYLKSKNDVKALRALARNIGAKVRDYRIGAQKAQDYLASIGQ